MGVTRDGSSLKAMQIPRLGRNLARDRVRLGRVFPRLGSHEAIPAAEVYQRNLNEKP